MKKDFVKELIAALVVVLLTSVLARASERDDRCRVAGDRSCQSAAFPITKE